MSPEPVTAMAARGPEVGGGNLCQMSASRLETLINDCQMVCPLLSRSRKLWKIAPGLSEEAQCNQGAILNCASWLLPNTLSSR